MKKSPTTQKAARVFLALVLLPFLVGPMRALNTAMGMLVNVGQFGGVAVTLGSKTGASSIPVVIASDQGGVPVTGTFWQATQAVSGTFWQATQPVSNAGTFAVQAAAVLAAETTKVIGTVNIAAAQVIGVTGTFWQATQPVSIASMPSTPVTGTFWQATQPVSGTVSVSGSTMTVLGMGRSNGVPPYTRFSLTNVSSQMLPANANRVGLECELDCDATTRVYHAWGASAATNTSQRLEVCGSWQPPASSTVAIQGIAVSGTQTGGCTEYLNQ